MPSLIEFIRRLQDVEYERSANAMLSAIAQMSKGQGSEVQALITALEKKAKAITEASKLVSSETYSQMLAGFRAEMNRVETLIRQTAPNIELSGARAANNSVTARLFYGTSQDMIDAGLDPTSAEAMAYFMQLTKDVGIPFEVPKPEDLVTKYSQSEEFYNHMDKWGDGYADYFDDAIRNGVREGWSPAKVARYARNMATDIPVNAAYTWTRTLQLQSYRDASAQMELLNGRFIEKKIRIAALDGRTCFPAGTKIKTPSGYKNIEDIKVGDSVLTHELSYKPVIELFDRDYEDDFVTIKTRRGKSVECTKDHPILVVRGGVYEWIFAKDVEIGDSVLIANNDGSHNVFHLLRDITIKRRIRNADDSASLFNKIGCFSPVSIGALTMPIDAVNFNDATFGNEKVNSIPSYLFFLCKRIAYFFKTHSKVSLWLRFVLTCMIAGCGAIFASVILGVVMALFYQKFFPAISAVNANSFIGRLMQAFSGTVIIIGVFYALFVNKKLFPAVGTYCGNLAGSIVRCEAFIRAVLLGSPVDFFRWVSIKDNSTYGTFPFMPLRGKLGESGFMIAFGRTKLSTRFARNNKKLSSALFTNFFYTHETIISKTTTPVKSVVYNIEVYKDNTYFANDVLVHNCPACIALHGTEVSVGTAISDHFNGRCDAIYVPAGGEMPEFMQAMSEPGKRQFVEWQNGTDWFDAQSDAYKKQVLGVGRFELYKQGKFKLDADFVNWHEDDVFGMMPGAKPLKELKKQFDTDDKT